MPRPVTELKDAGGEEKTLKYHNDSFDLGGVMPRRDKTP
jgi:hypothetical protein